MGQRREALLTSIGSRIRGGDTMRPKVRHVAVMTKNREKMVEFYQKIFGLEPKRGFGGAIYMSDGDVNIALIEAKRDDQKEGINHFGFEVDDLDDIKRRLRKQDLTPRSIRSPIKTRIIESKILMAIGSIWRSIAAGPSRHCFRR